MSQANALITLDEYKRYDGSLSGTASDVRILELIDAASDLIEAATNGHVYVRRTLTEDYAASNNPSWLGGARRLYLQERPIVSVTSITDDDGSTVSLTDFTIVAAEGYLEHDWFWPAPTGRWTVIYVAGEALTNASLNWRVKQACCIEVYRRFHQPAPSLQSVSRGGRGGSRSVSMMEPKNPYGLSDEAYALIRPDIVMSL